MKGNNVIAACVLLYLGGMLQAETGKASILMNERTVDKPLTLQAGRVDFRLEYAYSTNLWEYDRNANPLSPEVTGKQSNGFAFSAAFRWGIFDFLSFSAETSLGETATRDIPQYYGTGSLSDAYVTGITVEKGLSDVYLELELDPFPARSAFHWSVGAGCSIPPFAFGAFEPVIVDTAVTVFRHEYSVIRRYPRVGTGITPSVFSRLKVTSGNFALTGKIGTSFALNEEKQAVNTWAWKNKSISTEPVDLTVHRGILLNASAGAGIQAASWLAFSVSAEGLHRFGSYYNLGEKINVLPATRADITGSMEFRPSPELTITQKVSKTVWGVNTDGPLRIDFMLTYSGFVY